MSITIFAIESSCDETSASVCKDGVILSNCIATQAIHEQYGGVVPELASRAHMENIVPVAQQALLQANTNINEIDAFAFTQSPGLIGSLLVGAQFVKSLALACEKPLLAINHMQAHVLANLIEHPHISFPFLCLTVSGGHTQIVLAHSAVHLEIIGETIDDAAGEAFDKTAKMLGLPYPGGPMVDHFAQQGNPLAFTFSQPNIPNLNFSFSGLKTSVLYFLQKQEATFIQNNLSDICASVQHTIIDILLKKLSKAVKQTSIKRVCLAGGVSANKGLRNAFTSLGKKQGWNTFIPTFEFCTDNAAMIAITAYHHFLQNRFVNLDVTAQARHNA